MAGSRYTGWSPPLDADKVFSVITEWEVYGERWQIVTGHAGVGPLRMRRWHEGVGWVSADDSFSLVVALRRICDLLTELEER